MLKQVAGNPSKAMCCNEVTHQNPVQFPIGPMSLYIGCGNPEVPLYPSPLCNPYTVLGLSLGDALIMYKHYMEIRPDLRFLLDLSKRKVSVM